MQHPYQLYHVVLDFETQLTIKLSSNDGGSDDSDGICYVTEVITHIRGGCANRHRGEAIVNFPKLHARIIS